MRGYTVEMSFLMPIILLLIMSSIFGIFYFHDKNILVGAAYETVAVGSTKAREKDSVKENELEALFRERIGDKCILLTGTDSSVAVNEDEIEFRGKSLGRGMTVSVLKRMSVTDPEKKIRDIRRIKGLTNGTKDNN